MAGNSFDVGERKTHEIDSSKPSEFNDAFEGFSKTKRESFTDRVKAHSGVHLDTPTSTPWQKETAPESEKETVEQQAVSTPDLFEMTESQHHDWFKWVKQFRSVDTQPVTRINGCSVVPSVKKAIARFARLGTLEQRIMLDALDLMTKDEHMTVVNSYYDSFATDTNEGGYSHADNEDVQQYAQQLAESQQREHELQNKVDELQAELVGVYDHIEHEDARAQVDAGLKDTAADPHRDDDDSAPIIDGAADKEDAEEGPTIDQPDKQASQGADETAGDEAADDSTAGSDDDEPVIDNPSGADDEPDDDEDNDAEDSDVEGFDDFASEMEENANPEEDAAIAAQAAQDQQKAEAEAAAELEQQRQVEAQEQAEGE